MDRAAKVNDVVSKKTKKEEKTNQKHKKRDGLIRKKVFEKKKIQKKRKERCCIMKFRYNEKDLKNGWLVDKKKLLASLFCCCHFLAVWGCVLDTVCTATAVHRVPR